MQCSLRELELSLRGIGTFGFLPLNEETFYPSKYPLFLF